MNTVLRQFGSYLARYLTRPRDNYEQFSVLNKEQLDQTLEPGDLLLVEGNSRVSTAIKYLTQSTCPGEDGAGLLVEADVVEGVIRSPLSKYIGFNVRVCRAVNLSAQDSAAAISFVPRLGHRYDTAISSTWRAAATPPLSASAHRIAGDSSTLIAHSSPSGTRSFRKACASAGGMRRRIATMCCWNRPTSVTSHRETLTCRRILRSSNPRSRATLITGKYAGSSSRYGVVLQPSNCTNEQPVTFIAPMT
jgi:hypothetical protein